LRVLEEKTPGTDVPGSPLFNIAASRATIALMNQLFTFAFVGISWVIAATEAAFAQIENLHDLPSDLTIPSLIDGPPSAGKRVKLTLPEYAGWDLFHTVYLPTDWSPDRRFPIIFEYPGNGGYQNALGDKCTGLVEDCRLGYGLSGGRGFIWVCLPFVNTQERKHQLNWWGDADETARYCQRAVEQMCRDFGGDRSVLILTGFSRGAIACSYIGLRNDEIAGLWLALLPHSHYDGVRKWPYADSDEASALVRLQRLKSRPQFLTHEKSIDATRTFLVEHQLAERAEFVSLPFPNHSDAWVLKDLPERKRVREWLQKVLDERGNTADPPRR
jgi:hypothetical protein